MASYKKPCNHCKAMIDGNVRFCPVCGSISPFGYNCPFCLKEILANDTLCSGCGKPLRVGCPVCGGMVFAGKTFCEHCGSSLTVVCPNPLCGQQQFFLNSKCTACGKKIKK